MKYKKPPNPLHTPKLGVANQSSRHQRRRQEALERALEAGSLPKAAKILRRMK